MTFIDIEDYGHWPSGDGTGESDDCSLCDGDGTGCGFWMFVGSVSTGDGSGCGLVGQGRDAGNGDGMGDQGTLDGDGEESVEEW